MDSGFKTKDQRNYQVMTIVANQPSDPLELHEHMPARKFVKEYQQRAERDERM